MQRFSRLANSLSSPAILIVVVWCSLLACVAIGPVDYPGQPSSAVLMLIGTGVALFILGHGAGAWCFGNWFKREANVPAPSFRSLNSVVIATSLIGVGGVGLIAFDRLVLSGVSNSGYSELLRCAPGLVDFIEIRRTPLLYVGYLTFSFGFASLALFFLKGEEIRGWAAIAAQISIVSPVGYALLYSGRMPILFIIVLVVSAMLVRTGQGRRPLPPGHYLLLKTAFAIGLFAIYSSSIWSSRQNFCNQMSGLIQELQQEQKDREPAGSLTDRPKSASAITATDLSKRLAEANASPVPAPMPDSTTIVLATMLEAWNVRPRGYIASAIASGHLPLGGTMTFLSTYFYLTHGVRATDIAWRARAKFSPNWGIYEIGILSPILRVFRPQDQRVADMEVQLKLAGIHGFFPTVWTAAYVDFGAAGSVIYILIWGFVAGWSAAGTRRSMLATPSLLLVFILATIFLSPIQGPLGIANSALVLFSMIITGVAIDLTSLRGESRSMSSELQLGRSVS
jgi:hypothetical protein